MIDQLRAFLREKHALIGEIGWIDVRLQFGGRDIARIVDKVIGLTQGALRVLALQHARIAECAWGCPKS